MKEGNDLKKANLNGKILKGNPNWFFRFKW